jgi:hypothetical protein
MQRTAALQRIEMMRFKRGAKLPAGSAPCVRTSKRSPHPDQPPYGARAQGVRFCQSRFSRS